MLKEHLKYSNISIYKLSKESGVPYSSVNDLVNNKVDINMLKYQTVKSLAHCLGYSSDQFYLLCTNNNYVFYENLYGHISFVENKPKIDIYNLKGDKIDDKFMPDLKEYNDVYLYSLGRYFLKKEIKLLEKKRIMELLKKKNGEV